MDCFVIRVATWRPSHRATGTSPDPERPLGVRVNMAKAAIMKCFWVFFLGAATLFAQPANVYDLVVYGATAAGVITSVSGARMGLKVALLEPRTHVGGMVSGGLSHTDVGRREVIGGYSLEFYWRAGRAYGFH